MINSKMLTVLTKNIPLLVLLWFALGSILFALVEELCPLESSLVTDAGTHSESSNCFDNVKQIKSI